MSHNPAKNTKPNAGKKTNLHFANAYNSSFFCNYCATYVNGDALTCSDCGGDFSHIPTYREKWSATFRK